MNKIIFFLNFIFFVHATPNMYWDLGIAISPHSNQSNYTKSIELSTYNRIEGLKKYYIDDFSGAIFHFESLNDAMQQIVLYEYIDSYYSIGQPMKALSILTNHNNAELSDNILYLKSQVLMMLGDYEQSIVTLNDLTNNFPSSDYLEIIKFDLEKINLLK
tara:strand:+ start:132 stop:611 length:480 start_codon:yes stop_codon:yes gene_type:complete